MKVIAALREWEAGLGWRDIVEETGLSQWDVRQVLSELIKAGLVQVRMEPLPTINPTRWRKLYVLKA